MNIQLRAFKRSLGVALICGVMMLVMICAAQLVWAQKPPEGFYRLLGGVGVVGAAALAVCVGAAISWCFSD